MDQVVCTSSLFVSALTGAAFFFMAAFARTLARLASNRTIWHPQWLALGAALLGTSAFTLTVVARGACTALPPALAYLAVRVAYTALLGGVAVVTLGGGAALAVMRAGVPLMRISFYARLWLVIVSVVLTGASAVAMTIMPPGVVYLGALLAIDVLAWTAACASYAFALVVQQRARAIAIHMTIALVVTGGAYAAPFFVAVPRLAFELVAVGTAAHLIIVSAAKAEFAAAAVRTLRPTAVVTLASAAGKATSMGAVDARGGATQLFSAAAPVASTMAPDVDAACAVCEAVRDPEAAPQYMTPSALMWWNRGCPRTWAAAFQYPHPLLDAESRFHSFTVATLAVVAVFGPRPWALGVMAFMTYSFAAQTLCGPLLSPQAWLVQLATHGLYAAGVQPVFIAGPPKQFANFMTVVMIGGALVARLLGAPLVTTAIMCAVFVFALLQGVYGHCTACFMVWGAATLGCVPESTLAKLRIVFLPALTSDVELVAV